MNSNNQELNPRQRELVERLEEIRQKRMATDPVNKRAEDVGEQRRQEPQTRRNRNRNRRRTIREAENRTQKREVLQEKARQAAATKIERRPTQTQRKSTPKHSKNSGKNIIETLSDGDKLADAMILSEILSVPVALRKRYM